MFDPFTSFQNPPADAPPVPRRLERIHEDGQVIEVIFHVEGDLAPPVHLVMSKITVPYLMRFVRQLRRQDAIAVRAIRRCERRRAGGPRRLAKPNQT